MSQLGQPGVGIDLVNPREEFRQHRILVHLPVILDEQTVVLIHQVPLRGILPEAVGIIVDRELLEAVNRISQPERILQRLVESAVPVRPEGVLPAFQYLLNLLRVLRIIDDQCYQLTDHLLVHALEEILLLIIFHRQRGDCIRYHEIFLNLPADLSEVIFERAEVLPPGEQYLGIPVHTRFVCQGFEPFLEQLQQEVVNTTGSTLVPVVQFHLVPERLLQFEPCQLPVNIITLLLNEQLRISGDQLLDAG